MSIKLIAIDIDGTLLNNDRKITPAVYKALKDAEAQGVRIVLCTGRPVTGVQELLKGSSLNSACPKMTISLLR